MTRQPTPTQLENTAILRATETFIDLFVARPRRERYKLLLRRGDFAARLHHDLEGELVERFRVCITGHRSVGDGILRSLRAVTPSTDAFVVGGPNAIKPGRALPIAVALHECVGWSVGSLILLDKGKTAFFEPEMAEFDRCILTRDPTALKTLRGR